MNWCMSSRREVLIRTLAKCLKWHYLTVRSMKNVAVLTQDAAFVLNFHPHPGGFDSSRVPTPGKLHSKAEKKNANAQGSAGAGGID